MLLTNEQKSDMQGIIGSGYGHLPYIAYVFLHIDDAAMAREWLKDVIPAVQTGADWQRDENGKKIRPESALHVAFTFAGLRTLGLPDDALRTFSLEFMEGMAAPHRARILGDVASSHPSLWDIGGAAHEGDNAIHLMLVLYIATDEMRRSFLDALREQLSAHDAPLRIVHSELGQRPQDEREHFGFRDGISNPKILGISRNEQEPAWHIVNTGEFVMGYRNAYDQFPPTPAINDPDDSLLPRFTHPQIDDGYRDFGKHGTYVVYRKLEQDVAGFWNYVRQAASLDDELDIERMRRLAARMIGRWPGGAPLTTSPDDDDPDQAFFNDFTYMQEDAHGVRCPYSSHIRRANPRDSFVGGVSDASFVTANQHRILRRGSVYGQPIVTEDMFDNGFVPTDIVDDGHPRGLHFMCINTDIRRQFEFVQQGWCNNPKFNGLYNDKDSIIGDSDGTVTATFPGNPLRERIRDIPRFVTVRGGDYFFLPSITALRYLAYRDA